MARDVIDGTATPATPSRYRRFAVGFVVTFALLGLFFAAVNIVEYSGSSERGWKTRRLEEKAGTADAPDVFILGSSRVMQIRPEYVQAITGGTAFNYGVSAAEPVDFYAQIHYLTARHFKLRTVIIGIDQNAFSDIPPSHLSDELLADRRLFPQLPGREQRDLLASALSAMSMESTGEAIGRIFTRPGPRKNAYEHADEILLDNGYLLYKTHELDKEAGKFRLEAGIRRRITEYDQSKARFGDAYFRLSERKLELFAQTLDIARAGGADVRIVLLPTHPEFIASQGDGKLARLEDDLAARLSKLCADRGCVFRDYRSIDRFGGDANEFWDGFHQTPENLRRMVNALYDLPPGRVVVNVRPDLQTVRHLPKVTTVSSY